MFSITDLRNVAIKTSIRYQCVIIKMTKLKYGTMPNDGGYVVNLCHW